MRLVIKPLAEQDIEVIGDYIARDNPARAVSFVGELREQCMRIADNPLGYRERPELAPGLRSCAHGNYVIFFDAACRALRRESRHNARCRQTGSLSTCEPLS